jgi:hypothetical protein
MRKFNNQNLITVGLLLGIVGLGSYNVGQHHASSKTAQIVSSAMAEGKKQGHAEGREEASKILPLPPLSPKDESLLGSCTEGKNMVAEQWAKHIEEAERRKSGIQESLDDNLANAVLEIKGRFEYYKIRRNPTPETKEASEAACIALIGNQIGRKVEVKTITPVLSNNTMSVNYTHH